MTHLEAKEAPVHPQLFKETFAALELERKKVKALEEKCALLEGALNALNKHTAVVALRTAAEESHLSPEKMQVFADESIKLAWALLGHLDQVKKV